MPVPENFRPRYLHMLLTQCIRNPAFTHPPKTYTEDNGKGSHYSSEVFNSNGAKFAGGGAFLRI